MLSPPNESLEYVVYHDGTSERSSIFEKGARSFASSFQIRSNSCIISEKVEENFFPEAALICFCRLKSLNGLLDTLSKYFSMKSGSS